MGNVSCACAPPGPLVRWRQSTKGNHIELGIAENNFYLALAMFGLSHEFNGEVLFPVGTLYDPFVARGLDALIYGVYPREGASQVVKYRNPAQVPLAQIAATEAK